MHHIFIRRLCLRYMQMSNSADAIHLLRYTHSAEAAHAWVWHQTVANRYHQIPTHNLVDIRCRPVCTMRALLWVMFAMSRAVRLGKYQCELRCAGDIVKDGDIIAQIETDKVTIDVRYTEAKPGKIKEILINKDDTVAVGQDVAVVEQVSRAPSLVFRGVSPHCSHSEQTVCGEHSAFHKSRWMSPLFKTLCLLLFPAAPQLTRKLVGP